MMNFLNFQRLSRIARYSHELKVNRTYEVRLTSRYTSLYTQRLQYVNSIFFIHYVIDNKKSGLSNNIYNIYTML